MQFLSFDAEKQQLDGTKKVIRFAQIGLYVAGSNYSVLATGVKNGVSGADENPVVADYNGQALVGADGTFDVRITDPDGGDPIEYPGITWADIKQQRDDAVAAHAAIISLEANTQLLAARVAEDRSVTESVSVAAGAHPTSAATVVPSTVPAGTNYWVRSADGKKLILYRNDAGAPLKVDPEISVAAAAVVDDLALKVGESATTNRVIAAIKDGNGCDLFVVMQNGRIYLVGFDRPLKDHIEAVADSRIYGTAAPRVGLRIDGPDGRALLLQLLDGALFLPGLPDALQRIYTIRYAADVRQAVTDLAVLKSQVAALTGGRVERTIWGFNKNGALFPVHLKVSRLTRPSDGYHTHAWPQGKLAADSTGRVYVGYNRGSDHVSADKVPVVVWTDDRGATFSSPVEILHGTGYSRGADCWALGVDASNVVWAIVRDRGASNAVGVTFYRLQKSIDRGATWTNAHNITEVTQGGFVPELFHDLTNVNGKMVSGFHFAASNRVGFIWFDPSTPTDIHVVDFPTLGDGNSTTPVGVATYCEATFTWDQSAGKVYGGFRTQNSGAYPAKWFVMSDALDGSGYAMFSAPDNTGINPYPIKSVGSTAVSLSIQRSGSGNGTLWFGPQSEMLAGNLANFFGIKFAQIIRGTISSSNENGVADMEVVGDNVFLSWSVERDSNDVDAGGSDVFFATFNLPRSAAYLSYEVLESMP